VPKLGVWFKNKTSGNPELFVENFNCKTIRRMFTIILAFFQMQAANETNNYIALTS
jgi:hypothetical protein